ncbi:MAG: hypothetical protein A3H76_05070 [Candidatus Lloydbacteria bacterium RIFCSPLOWO2_02_FULL_54_12]|nr:MAG: hypothetical protein A3H76_05070 [Candidatus Lloydbacteria bacterium RIFCSPLOWO2_02_FULL_54_12]
MIIELIGLPGAGKTTFAKHLAEGGEWSLVKVGGKSELLFYNALFLGRHPIVFLRTLFWLFRHIGRRELRYTKFVNLFLVHNAKYMKAGKYPRAVIDQGHHQNVIALFDERVADGVIDRYAHSLPKPDLLVFFAASDEVRTKRLSGRGYGARDEADKEYREGWEEARGEHFERLYLSRSLLPCATETVSPEDEADKLKKIAHARLWHFVLHGRMPTEKAHGLQIAKTLEAFFRTEAYAVLWIPRGGKDVATDIAEYYGLVQPFPVRSFSAPNFLRLPALFGPLRYWLDALFFFLPLLFTRLARDGVFSTRSPELAWLFKVKGVSAWYEAHSFPASKEKLLRFFLRRVDGIVANSKGTADAFLDHGFRDTHVVRNGVDLKQFADLPHQAAARGLLRLPPDRTVVMYVGTFYAWKGVLFLLETWRRYFSKREDLLLVLVGGTEEDLKRYGGIGAYRASENVLLVPHVPAEKTRLYLAGADVLVLPNSRITEESVRFTSPIKLFEYMASGKPIVAADLPSIREVLAEGMGTYFQADNSEALRGALDDVLHSPNEAKHMADTARKAVRLYDWGARAQLMLNIVRGHSREQSDLYAQFVQTFVSGGLAALLNLVLVYALTEFFGLWYVASAFVAYVVASLLRFLWLKFVFVGGARKVSREAVLYALVTVFNVIVNTVLTYILVERFHLWYMLVQFVIIAGLTVINFVLYRTQVFRTVTGVSEKGRN